MKIKKMLYQHRRDFEAIFECEHCGATRKDCGYDDAYFHSEVIPKMKCKKCNKTAKDSYKPLKTKYPEGMQI